jgi:hypothetical protein
MIRTLVPVPFALLVAAVAIAKEGDTPAATSAAEQAAMQKMMEMATPGEAHKKLEPMVGTWTTTVTMWMDPAAPPQTSEGVSENRMVLGGRWLEQRFEGTFLGGPFSGIGYTGYDNAKNHYVGWWMDTATTAAMMSIGKADASGKKMTFQGAMDDPMTGEPVQLKDVLTIVDADHHNFEMWTTGPDGTSHKSMEIQYVRKM